MRANYVQFHVWREIFVDVRSSKKIEEGNRVNTKIMRRSITLASERGRGYAAVYVACHRFIPSGLSQSGHFSRPCPPLFPRFFSSTTANWCMARDWSDCTHTKGILFPSPWGVGGEAAATSRGKNSVQPRLRKTVHAVSPNSARACSLIDFSTGSVPPAGHEPFFPPPFPPLVFAPIPARGPSLSNEIRDEIFFLLFSLSLLLSLSLWLRFEILSSLLSGGDERESLNRRCYEIDLENWLISLLSYSYFCRNIFYKNGLLHGWKYYILWIYMCVCLFLARWMINIAFILISDLCWIGMLHVLYTRNNWCFNPFMSRWRRTVLKCPCHGSKRSTNFS